MKLLKEINRFTKQYIPNNTKNASCYSERKIHYEQTRVKSVSAIDTSIVFDIERELKCHQQLADMIYKELEPDIECKYIKVSSTAGLEKHRFVFCTVRKGTPQAEIDSILNNIEKHYNPRIERCINNLKLKGESL